MNLKYRLLVFDWDGTLMDSADEIIQCFHSASADLGFTVPGAEEIRNIIGIGMHEAIIKLFPDLKTEADRQKLIDAYRHFYFHPEKEPAPLFAGVAQMLKQLEDDGFLLGVATSKGRRGLDIALERTELNKVFHCTRCIDDAQSKPHPQMLLDVLSYTGTELAEALMIGDTEYDLQMANNAGVAGLGVGCGAHDVERLYACEPVHCLDHTRELREWLHT